MVEKLLNVDLSRLEDGGMLVPVGQIYNNVRREWERSTDHSFFSTSATSPSTSLFVSSMSGFGTGYGYRTALSIFKLPSIGRTDRS